MRTIYIFESTNSYRRGYPKGWLNPRNWYRAGVVIGYILQFLAGVGIGFFIKVLFITLGII